MKELEQHLLFVHSLVYLSEEEIIQSMIGLALVGLPSPSGCRSIKGPIDKLLRSLGKGLIAIPVIVLPT